MTCATNSPRMTFSRWMNSKPWRKNPRGRAANTKAAGAIAARTGSAPEKLRRSVSTNSQINRRRAWPPIFNPQISHMNINDQRIISLVPSITESLFVLGLGDRVVGITDYCAHPADRLARLPRIGGTKNVRVAEVIALQPDLVIANREENTRADVEALQAAGIEVWVTFPETVRDAIDLLWEIVRRFDISKQGRRIAALETAFEWTAA